MNISDTLKARINTIIDDTDFTSCDCKAQDGYLEALNSVAALVTQRDIEATNPGGRDAIIRDREQLHKDIMDMMADTRAEADPISPLMEFLEALGVKLTRV